MGKATTAPKIRSLASYIGDGAEPLHTIEGQNVLVHSISEVMSGQFGEYVIMHITQADDPFQGEPVPIRAGGVVCEKLLAAKASIPDDGYPVSACFQKVTTKNGRECWTVTGDEEVG